MVVRVPVPPVGVAAGPVALGVPGPGDVAGLVSSPARAVGGANRFAQYYCPLAITQSTQLLAPAESKSGWPADSWHRSEYARLPSDIRAVPSAR